MNGGTIHPDRLWHFLLGLTKRKFFGTITIKVEDGHFVNVHWGANLKEQDLEELNDLKS